MSSRKNAAKNVTLTDLEKDFPTTVDDVVALRRLRATQPPVSFAALQAFVDELPLAARKPRRSTAAERPEFKL